MREPATSYDQGAFAFDQRPQKVAESGATYEASSTPARKIHQWMKAHRSWQSKEEILAGSGVESVEWARAINELLECGKVAKQGERRSTKYRAT